MHRNLNTKLRSFISNSKRNYIFMLVLYSFRIINDNVKDGIAEFLEYRISLHKRRNRTWHPENMILAMKTVLRQNVEAANKIAMTCGVPHSTLMTYIELYNRKILGLSTSKIVELKEAYQKRFGGSNPLPVDLSCLDGCESQGETETEAETGDEQDSTNIPEPQG